jgi:hypothetical protein
MPNADPAPAGSASSLPESLLFRSLEHGLTTLKHEVIACGSPFLLSTTPRRTWPSRSARSCPAGRKRKSACTSSSSTRAGPCSASASSGPTRSASSPPRAGATAHGRAFGVRWRGARAHGQVERLRRARPRCDARPRRAPAGQLLGRGLARAFARGSAHWGRSGPRGGDDPPRRGGPEGAVHVDERAGRCGDGAGVLHLAAGAGDRHRAPVRGLRRRASASRGGAPAGDTAARGLSRRSPRGIRDGPYTPMSYRPLTHGSAIHATFPLALRA